MKIFLHVLAAGLATAVATAPAAASVKIATYKGIISDGTDLTGVFGIVGQDLTGIGYVSSYVYDRERGRHPVTGTVVDSSLGGTYTGTPSPTSPIISTTITINGVSRLLSDDLFGYVLTAGHYYPTDRANIYHIAEYQLMVGANTIITYLNNGTNFSLGVTDLNHNVLPTELADVFGRLTISNFDNTGPDIIVHEFVSAQFSGSAVYSVAVPIPEPSSWAMLIAGFGLTGASLRRKRALRTA